MNFIKANKKVINFIIDMILIAVFVAAVVPFFITTKYALFVTDDFPLANAVVRNFKGSYFQTGLKCAANYWHVWNGNWFSFTIAYWLHPIVHGGQETLVLALRIQLFLAIVGAVYFCFSLIRFFDLQVTKTLRLLFIVVLPVLLFKEYFDFYLWWLTSCTYLMPLYCFLFGFGTFLYALKSKKIWQFVVSGILLLLMSGGSLNVVGMGCYSMLFALAAWCFYQKKICIPGVVVFILTLVGACVNAFAPGNFVRQNSQETTKMGVIHVLINELHIMGAEGKWLIFRTTFFAFVLLAFLWGSRLDKKITPSNLIIASIASLFLPVVTMFPVVLGYGDIDYKDISNRGHGMMDISIIFAACFLGVLWGVYFKDILKGRFKKSCIVAVLLGITLDLLFCGQKPSDFVPVQISKNIQSGYNKEFCDVWMEIFNRCENSEEENLIIEIDVPSRKAGCSWAKLSEDPEKWWNTSISEYYGLESLSVIDTLDD